MCNPRRVTVSVTHDINEEIQREVARTATLSARVSGEHRVLIPVGTRMTARLRAALETVLTRGLPGWTAADGAFRHEVRGGYVIYHPDTAELEVVAVRESDISADGAATRQVTVQYQDSLQAEGEGWHYDDNYGNKTPEDAAREAEANANKLIERRVREATEGVAAAAERAAAAEVEEDARRNARANLDERAAAERARLRQEAAASAQVVGVRAQQTFGAALAEASREAIVRYARENGGEIVANRENGGQIELEIRMQR
jgi:hypothetical protein